MNRIRADVTIVGSGVTGIMLTRKLSVLGLDVVLLECEPRLAAGTSTKNEGWLHRGTYHATSIRDRTSAIQVARRCIYGHEQVRRYAPEAIEEPDLESIAVTYEKDRVDDVVSRWKDAEVAARPMSRTELSRAAPEVRTESVAAAFWVKDLGINTRVLYRRNAVEAERAGATIIRGVKSRFLDAYTALLLQEGGMQVELQTRMTICAAGFGVKSYFKDNFGIDVPLRFWKSHLLIVPRLARHGVFCLDSGGAAMMNHDLHSIVGLNEDAIQCSAPDFEVLPQRAQMLRTAVDRLFFDRSEAGTTEVACVKVDMTERSMMARSLNISVSEPIPDQLCVLPGKMTEAPYVTDAMVKLVMTRLGCELIELRPCDKIDRQLKRISVDHGTPEEYGFQGR